MRNIEVDLYADKIYPQKTAPTFHWTGDWDVSVNLEVMVISILGIKFQPCNLQQVILLTKL